MKRLGCLATSLFLLLLLGGCSSMPQESTIANSHDYAIKDKLYFQYSEWKGAPYSYGGLSKKGVDCSGFTYVTYREEFGLQIPRTTQLQSQIGHAISRDELRPGDLIFFRTDEKERHVGIYIENNRFLHASTKSGVTISSLNDYYWQAKYWQSRRVDP